MKSEAMKLFDLPFLPMIGLLIFVFLFIGIVYWTYKASNQQKFDEAARLPLEENFHE